MKELIIIGAGGMGREAAWLAERMNLSSKMWKISGFIDEAPELKGKVINDYPVLGGFEVVKEHKEAYFVCAVGNAKVREDLTAKALKENESIRFSTLTDPSVIMSDRVKIGEGSIICAGAVITVNIEIGKHCIINMSCTVGHDAVLEDFVTLYPSVNVSGNVRIEKGTEVGTGAAIIQGKRIGAGSIIGAGGVVIGDIPNDSTAVGCPTKVIKVSGKCVNE